MRKKLFLLLLLLFISNDFVFGKNGSKTKSIKAGNKKHDNHIKENKTRLKRSLDDDIEKLFSPGKAITLFDHNLEERGRTVKLRPIVEKELPFWGTRGRRESASDETVPDVQLPPSNHHKNSDKIKNIQKLLSVLDDKQRRDEVESPFWGNRGRRDSDESEENDIDLFWANRGRRQDEEPFWGTRGRREEDSPFWGNRGRRDDDEPFWGNRGRRQETDSEPFWGNRGRRETFDPFWGSRGKKKTKNRYNKDGSEPFWGNRAKLKEKLKDSIIEAIENVQDNMNDLSAYKRTTLQTPFWLSRGRESKLKYLFNGISRNRLQNLPSVISKPSNELRSRRHEPNTVHDDRIFAEEPRYILVERNSRSSIEEDPYYISRGKKYSDFELSEVARGRRGALEEIVKSVRNDPYYIARGKKDSDLKIGNSSLTQDELLKTKDLVCSTVDLILTKHEGSKVKREIKDNERERRTILKKLAQQLQIDPYFVSRGKKNVDGATDPLEQFINNIRILCN